MTIRSKILGSLVSLAVAALPLAAQQDAAAMMVNAQRTMVSRAELQSTLDTIDHLLGSSSGYSAQLRSNKSAVADAIRARLREGDFHTGDVISISVVGVQALSAGYPVSSTGTISLPGGEEIIVKGKLRSEIQDHLTKELGKYVRDPIIRATPAIRIQISGAVGKVGFYNESASFLLTEVIQRDGGGPAGNARFEKSQIKRGDQVLVDGPEFERAIREGRTLDQLNVEAGDEIFVAAKPATGLFWRVLGGLSAVGSLIWIGHLVL